MTMRSTIFYSEKRRIHVYLDQAVVAEQIVVEWGEQKFFLSPEDWQFLCLLIGPQVDVHQYKVRTPGVETI